MRAPTRRPCRAPHRPVDNDFPATRRGWVLLIGQAVLGTLLLWVWLVLFLTAFS
jgi:hypothetical protein